MKRVTAVLSVFFLLLTLPLVSLAATGYSGGGEESIIKVLHNVLALATGGIARALFTLYLVGCFYLGLTDRLEWRSVVRGALCGGGIFGAAKIAQFLVG